MYCTKCGKELLDQAAFCCHCGAPTNAQQSARASQASSMQSEPNLYGMQNMQGIPPVWSMPDTNVPQGSIGANKVSTLACMAGSEARHYIPIFAQVERTGSAPATALGLIWPFWMLYRKMYKEFFIYFSVVFLTKFIPLIGTAVAIGYCIYMCINLKKLYYYSVVDKLRKHGLTGMDIDRHPEHAVLINRIGGTSVIGIIIYIIGAIVLAVGIVFAVSFMDTTEEGSAASRAVSEAGEEAKTDQVVYKTSGGEFAFAFPEDWEEEVPEDHLGLQCSSFDRLLWAAAIIKQDEEGEEASARLDYFKNYIGIFGKDAENFEMTDPLATKTEEGKKLTVMGYRGIMNGEQQCFRFTLIEFEPEYDKYIVMVQWGLEEEWEAHQQEVEAIAATAQKTGNAYELDDKATEL